MRLADTDADGFLEKYENGKRIGGGTFGAVMLVRQKKTNKYYAAKFLDPKARKHGSTSQELRILQSLDHDNVIKMIDWYPPFFPASSRECLNPARPEFQLWARKEMVLVFPAYDMDLKCLMRLRLKLVFLALPPRALSRMWPERHLQSW